MEQSVLNKMKPNSPRAKALKKSSIPHYLDVALRRLLDILAAVLGLLLFLPTFLLIAWAIKRDSPGPVLYRGRRTGRGGKEFKILKFRTMYESDESYNGSKVTAQDDPRITPLGKKLRDSKANELPQFWNVLVGEMSLVGPRPEDPAFVRTWPEEDRKMLLSVRPGITSPATIIYRHEESLLTSTNVMQEYLKNVLPSKLRLDTLYIQDRNIFNDLDVIFWTAIALLPTMRRFAVPEHELYWGPVSRLTVRYISWLLIDSFIAMAAISISGLIWRISGPLDVGIHYALLIAFCISWIFSLVNWVFGLNKVEWSRAPAMEAVTLGAFTAMVTLVVLYFNEINPWFRPLPAALVIMSGIFSFIGFVAVRYRERLITGIASRWLRYRGGIRGVGERVLVVGAGENGALASWLLGHTDFGRAISVVGMVDDDPRKQGMRIDGHSLLGTTIDIPRLVEELDIGLIFFTIDNINTQQRNRIVTICQSTPARIVLLPDILEILRHEMKIVSPSAPELAANKGEATLEDFLNEMQLLLEEGHLEAARESLAAYRQQVHGSGVEQKV